MGFKVICQIKKEPLKGLADVQEIFSGDKLTIECQEHLYSLSDAIILEL